MTPYERLWNIQASHQFRVKTTELLATWQVCPVLPGDRQEKVVGNPGKNVGTIWAVASAKMRIPLDYKWNGWETRLGANAARIKSKPALSFNAKGTNEINQPPTVTLLFLSKSTRRDQFIVRGTTFAFPLKKKLFPRRNRESKRFQSVLITSEKRSSENPSSHERIKITSNEEPSASLDFSSLLPSPLLRTNATRTSNPRTPVPWKKKLPGNIPTRTRDGLNRHNCQNVDPISRRDKAGKSQPDVSYVCHSNWYTLEGGWYTLVHKSRETPTASSFNSRKKNR